MNELASVRNQSTYWLTTKNSDTLTVDIFLRIPNSFGNFKPSNGRIVQKLFSAGESCDII